MPTAARRNQLNVLDNTDFENPGLAFARYLKQHGDEHNAAKALLDRMMNSSSPPAYRTAFTRWKELQQSRQKEPGASTLIFTGKLATPLAIGLGNESVTEVGLTTHHTYGMPVLPGSALKGLCRRGASRLQKEGHIKDEEFLALFGDTTSASYFTFWDAWYIPDSVGGKPFHRDTITVHHQEYYGSRGARAWPSDFDDPNPIPFLVIKPGAQFLFALDTPDEQWSDFAARMLQWSLANLGIGGKTNAGYGYFEAIKLPPPIEKILWENVLLTLDAGKGELTASGEGKKATASRTESLNLRAALSEAQQEFLRRTKKLQKVDVQVQQIGNAWKIVKIAHVHE